MKDILKRITRGFILSLLGLFALIMACGLLNCVYELIYLTIESPVATLQAGGIVCGVLFILFIGTKLTRWAFED